MVGKPYTKEELREFDRITNMLSSPRQMVRLDARLTLVPAFVEKHGKEKCDAMFEVLKARDAKKEKGRGR